MKHKGANILRSLLGLGLIFVLFAPGLAVAADLSAVPPISACADLAKVDLSGIGGADSAITAATETRNAAGILPLDFTLKDRTFNTVFLDSFRPLHPLYDAINPDLTTFVGSGGKLILWHGLADPHISPMTSVAYYRAVQKTIGVDAMQAFSRFHLFPGMSHCDGGEGPDQFDLLTPMKNWVVGGTAPEAIVATLPSADAMKDGGPMGRPDPVPAYLEAEPAGMAAVSRLVFPFPALAVWDGKGDPLQADSYQVSSDPASWPMRDWAGADLFTP